MSFFVEKLPSNGERKVTFREYTIDDAINVSSVNPRLTEVFSSRFLELVQTGENPVDPGTEMTIQDRRTLLFKYAAASLQDERLDRPEEYAVSKCPLCGERHAFQLSLRQLGAKLRLVILSPGENVSTTEFAGQKLTVTPLRGEHAEKMEYFDNRMEHMGNTKGEDSGDYQKIRIEKEVYRLLSQISLPDSESNKSDAADLKEKTGQWLRKLPAPSFHDLASLVAEVQEKMNHGIDFTYELPCPNFEGEDAKEGLVACSLPFRPEELISRI